MEAAVLLPGVKGAYMFVELRRNNQVIIPRRIAYKMGLDEGDRLDLVAEDGVLKFTPLERETSSAPDGEGESERFKS